MMISQVTPRIINRITIISGILLLCIGCSMHVNTKDYSAGKILLMPPRDMIQNGKPHPVAVGSGNQLQEYLIEDFSKTPFELILTVNNEFNNTEIVSKEVALNEAIKLGADYCLQIVLGDFLNAAPMTFRSDHVTLEWAAMYNVRNGEVVWERKEPFLREKPNPGDHTVLLKQHALAIVQTIYKNMK